MYEVVVFQGNEKLNLEAEAGVNLLELLQDNNLNITAPCGGAGKCGKCKVRIINQKSSSSLTGAEKELLSSKEIDEGVRLACQLSVKGKLEIEIEDEDQLTVLTESYDQQVELFTTIKKINVRLEDPTLEDQRDFLERLYDSLNKNDCKIEKNKNIYHQVIDKLATINKNKLFTVTIQDDKIIDLEEGDTTSNLYGIAVDIGTTTIALYLLNLNNGKEYDIFSLSNPQQKYGADVISRVNYSLENKDGVRLLQKTLIDGLNNAINHLLSVNNLASNNIYTITIAGNTIMLHTLLGISANSIAQTPYIPVFTDPLILRPSELGIEINSAGSIHLLPGISGYVGADIVGDLLVTNFNKDSWNLMIDIGTNGEIVLGNKDRLYSCSAAAGPAFEGANILFGMAGVPGAISEYDINKDGKPDYKTIGNQKAKGICGSGLVDIMAVLLRQGYLENTGAIKKDEELTDQQLENVVTYKGKKAFRVLKAEDTAGSEDILLTQKDIREFQLAMGAIIAGIKILTKEAGITYNVIETVYLAGGFGNYINPHNACYLGLLPAELEERIVRIGNGAGMGAKLYLLDQNFINLAEQIRKNVSYIELSSRADFQTEFMSAMYFGMS